MTPSRILPFFTVALLLLWGSPVARAATPSDFIRSLADQAVQTLQMTGLTLEQRETRFRSLLTQGFDMDFIGRFVLGKHMRTATPTQQAAYLEAFGDYVLRTYSTRLGGYAGETFIVVGERTAGKQDAIVTTRIDRPSGPPIGAEWRVRVIEGRYRVVDISVEGVSMAVTQRSEFAAVVDRYGMDGLIQSLQARVNRAPATGTGG